MKNFLTKHRMKKIERRIVTIIVENNEMIDFFLVKNYH